MDILLLPVDHIIDTIVETSSAVFGSEERTIRQLLDTNEDTQGVRKVHDQLKTVKYAPGYQLTFSLFSGDASNGVREWKMQEVIHGKAAVPLNGRTKRATERFPLRPIANHGIRPLIT